MKEINIINIAGGTIAAICLIVLCIKTFGNFPPTNVNWLYLAGLFVGGAIAASDSKK